MLFQSSNKIILFDKKKMRQQLFNDIYDRLNEFEEAHMHVDSFPTFEQGFQQQRCVDRRHRLKNIKLPYKNTEKFGNLNDVNFPSVLLNNEIVRDKFTGRFIQLAPTKGDRKI